MSAEYVGSVEFSWASQLEFARCSGDWNPLHMSEIEARRSLAGARVVHGAQVVVACLKELGLPVRSLKASFPRPVLVGERAEIEIVSRRPEELRVAVKVDGKTTTTLRLGLGEARGFSAQEARPIEDYAKPAQLALEQMEGRHGRVFPAVPQGGWADALMAVSTVAGMECPGRYSMISEIQLEVGPAEQGLGWEVSRVDDRLRLLFIDVAGMGMRGQVRAFALQPPAAQASMAQLAGVISRDEFAGHRALVVGGSRGLGELTAKVIAAGGGMPVITYSVGKDDAERVAEEIRAFGAECETLRYDIRCPEPVAVSASNLYYYATKRIAPTNSSGFDRALLDEYMEFYVDGFYAIWKAVKPERAFYPSTVYVDERPAGLTEYAMAKAAGEVMCADLPGVVVERLPRLLTDQTMTIVPEESGDTLAALLPIIRRVQWREETP